MILIRFTQLCVHSYGDLGGMFNQEPHINLPEKRHQSNEVYKTTINRL